MSAAVIAKLTKELAASRAREQALIIERNFWVEQGRALQNQLQNCQRMHADMFDQLGRGVVTEESIQDNLALASEELRQPIATVEAVNALVAGLKETTQGRYTATRKAPPPAIDELFEPLTHDEVKQNKTRRRR